jgi:8-oxo-dGTP pyrophosphatase MutT (NUDIX family)
MEPRQRTAVRVLLVNDHGAVLLFRGFDPAVPQVRYWFTPGGGVDPGEPSAQAAARELFEETGLALTPEQMGEPVHRDIANYSFKGVSYRQEQDFYLVRVSNWQVDTSGFDEVEVASTDGHRWWSMEELAVAREAYYPEDLLDVLKRLGIEPC